MADIGQVNRRPGFQALDLPPPFPPPPHTHPFQKNVGVVRVDWVVYKLHPRVVNR